jgi:pyridoxamine 5'-phosphate oxidase
MVLLKQFGADGFTFFTNYESRKGKQLAENPRAALVLYWPHLYRQVRIEGRVEQVSPAESLTYFHSRPRLSQLAATVSKQSRVITSRRALLAEFNDLRRKTGQRVIDLPKHWGGYRLIPHTFEFWRNRKNRLHERVRYRKNTDGAWTVEFLAP